MQWLDGAEEFVIIRKPCNQFVHELMTSPEGVIGAQLIAAAATRLLIGDYCAHS